MILSTALLLGVLTGILLAVGWVLGGLWGTLIALALAVIINFLSYWYSDRIVLKMYRAKQLHDPEMQKIVEHVAREARIPKPRLYLVKGEAPNAFATGRGPGNSAIAVTEGLMKLNKGEIEGVIAHEMAHIRNRDILISSIAATIGGAISFLAQMGYFMMFGRKGEGNLLGLVLIVIFAPLAAVLVRLAITRNREYKADEVGAVISKKPHELASALRKISEFSREKPLKGNSATSHMWIVNPFHKDWFTGLFATHPPIQKRIAKLERMVVKGE